MRYFLLENNTAKEINLRQAMYLYLEYLLYATYDNSDEVIYRQQEVNQIFDDVNNIGKIHQLNQCQLFWLTK